MLYGDTKIVGNLQFSDDHIVNRINNTSTITSVSTTTLPTESAVKGYVSNPTVETFSIDTYTLSDECSQVPGSDPSTMQGSRDTTATNKTFCYLTHVGFRGDDDKMTK